MSPAPPGKEQERSFQIERQFLITIEGVLMW